MTAFFDIRAFGATGDGVTNDAPATPAAIDACHQAGGGTVVVPAGATFPTGCRDVVVTGARIDTDLRHPNADGIDICCRQRVRISDCETSSGDDAISL